MPVEFADRMKNIKGSEIRELLKLTEKPEVISFAGGVSAPPLFPIEEMKKVSVAVLEDGRATLQYSTIEGYGPLKEKITQRMNDKLQTNVYKDDILITNGSQQGLDFDVKIFINEGVKRLAIVLKEFMQIKNKV